MTATLESFLQGHLDDLVRHLHVRVELFESLARTTQARAPHGRLPWYGRLFPHAIRQRCIADMAATVEMALLMELLTISSWDGVRAGEHPLVRIYWDTMECGMGKCLARMRCYAYHCMPVIQEGFQEHAAVSNVRVGVAQVESYIQKNGDTLLKNVGRPKPAGWTTERLNWN